MMKNMQNNQMIKNEIYLKIELIIIMKLKKERKMLEIIIKI